MGVGGLPNSEGEEDDYMSSKVIEYYVVILDGV